MIYDITVPIAPSLPAFPGDPPVTIEPVSSIDHGDPANVSRITFSTHCGTHIDAPLHFSNAGAAVDHLPLSLLIGKAHVADLRGVARIDRRVLGRLSLTGVERLLIRTDNSDLWTRDQFQKEYAHLTQDGAQYLLAKGVRLIGIDYLSIEPFDGNGEVHRLLLGSGVLIVEGLNLDGVATGDYELICLPLKIRAGDGAPVRAILRREERSPHPEFDPHTSKWPLA